jgi:flagellar hook-length control protein FliK
MLSSLSSSTAAAAVSDAPLTASDTSAIAADTRQLTGDNPVFAALLAGGSAEEDAESLPDATLGAATGDPQPVLEIDAEQWLQQALEQQQVQLQVRAMPSPQGDTQATVAATNSPALAPLPSVPAEVLPQASGGISGAMAASPSSINSSGATIATNPALWAARTATGPVAASLAGATSLQGAAAHSVEQALTSSEQSLGQAQVKPSLQSPPSQQQSQQALHQPIQQPMPHLVQQGAEVPLVDSPLLASATAEFSSPVVDRPASALGNSIFALGDKAVQDSSIPASAKLPTPEAKWGEQLLHTLRDQVQVQIQQRIQNATIRLDPPELGSLEIFLSHESGRLNVQINASQADVARLLQQTSDRLRQELAGGQFTQVNVQTSSEGQSGQQQSRHSASRFVAEEMIQVNGQPATDKTRGQSGQARDVLITV